MRWLPVRRGPRALAFALSLSAALLVGCADVAGTGSGGTEPGTAAPPDPTGATPTTGSPAITPTGAGPTVTLVRSGGIAGVRDTVVVQPDGRWQRDQRTGSDSGRLSAVELARLRGLAADPALAAEASRPSPDLKNCADGFVLALTVGPRTVHWIECGSAGRPVVATDIARLLLTSTG